MTKITKKESEFLQAILDSDYQDGENPVNNPVWTWSVTDGFGKSAGGIMASLRKKGLADCDENHTHTVGNGLDDACTWITAKGLEALNSNKENTMSTTTTKKVTKKTAKKKATKKAPAVQKVGVPEKKAGVVSGNTPAGKLQKASDLVLEAISTLQGNSEVYGPILKSLGRIHNQLPKLAERTKKAKDRYDRKLTREERKNNREAAKKEKLMTKKEKLLAQMAALEAELKAS